MDSFKINQKIDKLYNKNGFMEKYGGQLFLSIFIIFVVSVLFVYLQILNNLEPVKKNWGKERCNPFVIPLAGFINNTEKNKKSDSQYTIDNFEFCLGNIIQSSFQFVIDSFRFILSGIMTLFEDIFIILQGIIAWFLSIIKWILGFLENIWGLALQNVSSTQSLLNQTRDSFSKAVGMLIVVLYVKMLSFRMTIMWMITTPIFMLFTVVTGLLVKILTWCLKNQALTMAMWMKYIFCVAKEQLQSLTADSANEEAISSVAAGTASATATGIGVGEDAAGVVEEVIPIVGPVMSVATFAAAVVSFIESVAEGLMSVVDAIAGIVMSIGSAVLYAFGLAQCGVNVTQAIYRAYTLMTLMAQVTALVISILLIILLWGFNKVVLGQMNIPGQGIPGLSF